MNKPILILDCNYLCRRAMHTTGALDNLGIKTGTVFGFIKSVLTMRAEFEASALAFCFDSAESIRQTMFPGYKQARRDRLAGLSPEETAMEEDFYRQTNELRAIHLPYLGFKNIFHQSGYEADDIIADLTKRLRRDNKIIIVSTDRDLFQLLHKNVEIWNPTKRHLWSEKWFANEFQIPVNMWPTVKAIAGCVTDSIPGLPMIGEKTAAKYLSGNLKYDSPHYRKIENAAELIERNLQLVKLPLPGLRERALRPDEESNDKWAAFFAAHGFHSLRELIPGMSKFRHGEPAA